MAYVVGKFMKWAGTKIYDILLKDDKKILIDDADEKKVEEVYYLKLLNKKLTMIWYSHKKTQSTLRLLNKQRQSPISTETKEKRGWNSQENLSQPHGLPRQDYARNLLST